MRHIYLPAANRRILTDVALKIALVCGPLFLAGCESLCRPTDGTVFFTCNMFPPEKKHHNLEEEYTDGPGLYWHGNGRYLYGGEREVEVGHPYSGGTLNASCLVQGSNGHLTFGSGSYSVTITSGSLPPGLQLNSSSGEISGIPTERGHFVLTLSFSGYCADGSYSDTKQLIFHVKGSGKVVE